MLFVPKIRSISFDPDLHRYTDEDKLAYTSVTTCVNDYKEPFDLEYWSKYTAKKLGVSQQTVKNNWKTITDIANNKGTKIHNRLEDSVNDSIIDKDKLIIKTINNNPNELTGYEISLQDLRKTPLALHYPKILKLLEFYIAQGYKVYAEKRVYLYEYLIAGTIDLILIKGKEFIIVDWKTNKGELHFKSGYYKKVNGIKTTEWVDKKTYLKYPLNKLEDCKGIGYTLQLSSYAYILECWGYKCKELILCHIKETVEDVNIVKEKEVNIMRIKYLRQDIINMYNHKKSNQDNKGSQSTMRFSGNFSW